MSIDSFQLLLTESDYRRLSVVDSWQIFNEVQLLRYDYEIIGKYAGRNKRGSMQGVI